MQSVGITFTEGYFAFGEDTDFANMMRAVASYLRRVISPIGECSEADSLAYGNRATSLTTPLHGGLSKRS